jgi:hypothetical protein
VKMPLSADRLTMLVGAMENDRLVFLCGAGLSVPSPSFLPTAPDVAKSCFDKRMPIEALDPALEWDIDNLAGFFHSRGDFVNTFVPLVPWNDLAGAPNRGHAAVADLLVSRAAHGALSANFDTMIERWAENLKIDMAGALTGQEAIAFEQISRPLLKFHGCMKRGKNDTLWTHGQLAENAVKQRIESCSQWMNLHLPGKHLVVVGFWTDWGYLNSVLATAFSVTNASSVTVIDVSTSNQLQTKASDLWAKLHALSADFSHVQASADVALDQLRKAFSKAWAKKFYALGKPAATSFGLGAQPIPDTLSTDDLYDLRRDVEGIPYTRAATLKAPPGAAAEAALAHIKLIEAGAIQLGAWLECSGKTIRVVNGSGNAVDAMREIHKEPTTLRQADIVVCAGAMDLGVPAKLIASGTGSSVVSPAAGGGAQWLTTNQALEKLGIA